MIDCTTDLRALWACYVIDPESVWSVFRDALLEEGLFVLHGPHGSRALITGGQMRLLFDGGWIWQENQEPRMHSYASLGVSVAAIGQVCPDIEFVW